jgi:hypothetical protein
MRRPSTFFLSPGKTPSPSQLYSSSFKTTTGEPLRPPPYTTLTLSVAAFHHRSIADQTTGYLQATPPWPLDALLTLATFHQRCYHLLPIIQTTTTLRGGQNSPLRHPTCHHVYPKKPITSPCCFRYTPPPRHQLRTLLTGLNLPPWIHHFSRPRPPYITPLHLVPPL